jgi:hypothetical protein
MHESSLKLPYNKETTKTLSIISNFPDCQKICAKNSDLKIYNIKTDNFMKWS